MTFARLRRLRVILPLLLGCAGAVLVLTAGRSDTGTVAWRPVADAVADVRGLAWRDPPRVQVHGDEAYLAAWLRATHSDAPWTRRALEQRGVALRAIPPLLVDDLPPGFYSFRDRSVFLRTGLTERARRAVLQHELTHCLEDQHFSLGPRLRAAERDLDQAFALRCVMEGSAEIVREQLVDGSDAPLDVEVARVVRGDVRPAVSRFHLATAGLPHVLGPGYVREVVAARGWTAIDALYTGTLPSTRRLLGGPVTDTLRARAGLDAALAGLRFDGAETVHRSWWSPVHVAALLDCLIQADGGLVRRVRGVDDVMPGGTACAATMGLLAAAALHVERGGGGSGTVDVWAFDTPSAASRACDVLRSGFDAAGKQPDAPLRRTRSADARVVVVCGFPQATADRILVALLDGAPDR